LPAGPRGGLLLLQLQAGRGQHRRAVDAWPPAVGGLPGRAEECS